MTAIKNSLKIVVFCFAVTTLAQSEDISDEKELRSGYYYSRQDTRDIQDDTFGNPGFIYLERGEHLWTKVEGKQQNSCADCHSNASSSMAGVGATYPKINNATNKLINLGQRIQMCRTRHMSAVKYTAPDHEQENADLLSLEAYIMMQSNGMPLNVDVSGTAAVYFKLGRQLYHQRIGQSDLACYQCHDERVGGLLRAERISQGHINGFPAYILRWDRIASAHRRFQFCNEQARAEPLPLNHPDYNSLELYVAWRGNGLPIEIPSVRR